MNGTQVRKNRRERKFVEDKNKTAEQTSPDHK